MNIPIQDKIQPNKGSLMKIIDIRTMMIIVQTQNILIKNTIKTQKTPSSCI